MKKRFISIVVLVVALGVAWLAWYSHRSTVVSPLATKPTETVGDPSRMSDEAKASQQSQGDSSPPVGVRAPDPESEKRHLGNLAPLFLRPFSFYGKVVDERGNPVGGANVRYSIHNNPSPAKSGTRSELETDTNGEFTIRHHGLSIYIEVSKQGYYRVPKTNGNLASHGGFQNHDRISNDEVSMPTKESPATFLLHKAGATEPLIHFRKSIAVQKDGAPAEIDLSTGKVEIAGKGDLRIEVWTLNQGMNPNKAQPYDWECRISIPRGGLVERTDQFAFEAPEEGYMPSFDTGMRKNAERWKKGFEREFFVKLADGRFARFSIMLTTGGDHFVVLESYLNPTPGSRNLEFDPKKATSISP